MPDPNTNLHDDTSGSTGGSSSSGSTAVSATYYAKFKLKSNKQNITFYYYDNGVKKSKAISKSVDVVSHVSSKSVSNTVAKIPKGTSVSFVFGTKDGTTQPTPASILGTGTIVSVTYTTDISKKFTNTYYYSTGTQIYSFDKQDGKEIAVWSYKAPATWSNYFTTNYLTDRIYNAGTTLSNAPTHTIPGVGTTDPVSINLECYGDSSKTSSTYTAIVLLPGLEGSGKTGYHQTGWCYGSSTGTNYGYAKKVEIPNLSSKVVKLYANAVANTYYIKYNGNGNTSGSTTQTTATYDKDVTLRSNGFTRTGYEFKEWNTKSDGKGTSYSGGQKLTTPNFVTTNGGSITLYAIWTPKKYTITFNLNGGTFDNNGNWGESAGKSNVTAIHNVTYDSDNYYATGKATKAGYLFKGWYTSTSNDVQVYNSNGSAVAGTYWSANGSSAKWQYDGSINVYAQWTPINYNINYTLNGGDYDTYHPTSAGFEDIVQISNPTRTGYDFAGWTFAGGNTSTAMYGTSRTTVTTAWTNANTKVTATYFKSLSTTNNGTVTLFAQWTPKIIAITLDKNGGSGGTTTIYRKYDSTKFYSNSAATTEISIITKPANGNNLFTGYYNSKTSDIVYIDLDGYFTVNATTLSKFNPDSAVTWYAQWTDGTLVTFDCNGGTKSDASIFTRTMKYNTTANSAMWAPVRTGYVFDGWYDSSNKIAFYSAYTDQQGTPHSCAYAKAGNYWTADYLYPNDMLSAKWKYTRPTLTLIAKWHRANSYAFWNNAWHGIGKIYAFKDGSWKLVNSFKAYKNGWKNGV